MNKRYGEGIHNAKGIKHEGTKEFLNRVEKRRKKAKLAKKTKRSQRKK